MLLMGEHTCPWRLAYAFDNSVRRLLHKPEKILDGLVKKGQTVLDIGCGMGYFSIGMAVMVGDGGRVISVDLQQEMLDILGKRSERAGVRSRIQLHRCQRDRIGITEPVDFALAFWMVHEVSDKAAFLKEVAGLLKGDAKLLVAEPKLHVSASRFDEIVEAARKAGLRAGPELAVRLSRAIIFSREDMAR